MSRTITWLHLSDLHLCKIKTGWEANQIIESLRADLRRMHDQGLQPDIAFFTGDAAYGHLGKEPGLSIGNQ